MLRLRTFGGLHIEADGLRRGDLDAQQQLLGLLVVVASAGKRGASRSAVTRIFWPESTRGSDRSALSTALYRLRGFLGDDVLVGKETLRLNSSAITSDLTEFEELVSRRRFDQAARLYEGEFLHAFSLRTVSGFDDWADAQRTRLAVEYRHVLETLIADANDRRDSEGARMWLRRLVKHLPHDAAAAERLDRSLRDPAGGAPAAAVPRPAEAPLDDPTPSIAAATPAPVSETRTAPRLSARWVPRGIRLAALVPAIVVVTHVVLRILDPGVRVLEPRAGDTVAVRPSIIVAARGHPDLWLWIRTGGQCWLRGPFKPLAGGRYSLVAQFGQDGPRQSGYPYWFVVLAGPKLAPVHRVEDRRLDDCRFELLQPDAHSDTVRIYRR